MTAVKKRKTEGAKETQGRPPGDLTLQDVDAAQVVYVDSLVHLGVGPFISKATFAIQGAGGTKITPTIVLTMPTNQLFEAAKHMMVAVVNSDSDDGFAQSWDTFLQSIRIPPTE